MSSRILVALVGLLLVIAIVVFAVSHSRSTLRSAATLKTACDDCPSQVATTFQSTVPNQAGPPGASPDGMVWIPGGEFSMGSTAESESLCGMPGVTEDALPVHRVYVDGFWMDATELTNEQFDKFVKATGYVTTAERTPTREEFPDAPAENLAAGSTVFTPTAGEVPSSNWSRSQRSATPSKTRQC